MKISKIKRTVLTPFVLIKRKINKISRNKKMKKEIQSIDEIFKKYQEYNRLYLKYDRSQNKEEAEKYRISREVLKWVLNKKDV